MSKPHVPKKRKTQVVSLRLKEEQMERLGRAARRLGRTASETGALLVDEALRRIDFGHIDFRNSAAGRQAYVQGSTLAVWEVLMVARSYKMDIDKTAKHLEWPVFRVQAAVNYAKAFPDEINSQLEDNLACDSQSLSRLLPQMTVFTYDRSRAKPSLVKESKANYKAGKRSGKKSAR